MADTTEDELTLFLDEVVKYDDDVEAALQEIFKSEDDLDDPDFDPVAYINKLFPTEHSLAELDESISSTKKKLRVLDTDIQSGIRLQSRHGLEGRQALTTAQSGMLELMQRITSIGEKAQASEQMVKEITRDIKSLDLAKRNLTQSITTLNHLHMLVGGVDQLESMVDNRLYSDAANLLGAAVNVLEHFDSYKNVPQIIELTSRIESIKRKLKGQISTEFRKVYRAPEPDFSDYRRDMLQEACAVLDVLDESVRDELLDWFVDLQLRDYGRTFEISGEQAWLDKVDRRFAWFKRMVAGYLEHSHTLFPQAWQVPQRLALKFCQQTQAQLGKLIKERRDEIDVKLLLFAVQKTTQFELWLASKFKSSTVEEDDDDSEEDEEDEEEDEAMDEADEIRRKYLRHRKERERKLRREAKGLPADAPRKPKKTKVSPFVNAISHVYTSCLDIYVTAQADNLATMLDQFNSDFKSSLVFPDDDGTHDEGAQVLPSSGDMFIFFRNAMVQCSALSNEQPLFDLHNVFKNTLSNYASTILKGNLPKASSIAQLLMKEAEIRLTPQEIYLVCSILNTADYCQGTAVQLEEKFVEKLADQYKEKVDMKEEQDAFNDIISTCTQVLVRALESQCEPGLSVMVKTRWDSFEEVGDTSPFVSQIGKHISATVPLVRTYLGASNRKYFTNFCLKFVNSFGPRLVTTVKKCKHVTTVGAEQLLMDMQSTRTALMELPSVGSATARRAPAHYAKFVREHMLKAEMILKFLMNPVTDVDPSLYVQDYVQLVGSEDGLAGFQRVLEMKGLKKSEQQPFLTYYKAQMQPGELAAQEAAKKTRKKSGSSSPKRSYNLRKLEGLMKRFPIKTSSSNA
eukprot:TRINITY_DN11107_c0_g1_i5.p1 TRINITY_DN11107_c0_g1~~TRINITY_DN11107_c0_g1_i5.p1  ORF type:complete len:881 (+),score=282.96 TRINITY_DN11107_c0_g1_i5:79-2643(+)